VSPQRIAKLRAIAGWVDGCRPIGLEPMMAAWLTDPAHRLLIATAPGGGARTLARGSSWRTYRLTPLGERVLIAAQLADRESELKREIVAESVARHS
jgi:hypothetical protein